MAMQKSHWKQLGPKTRHTAGDLQGVSATQNNLCIGGLVEQIQAEDCLNLLEFGKAQRADS